MPTINDATVVAQPYDTSGNGGRKLISLSNGWLVAALFDSSVNRIVFYKTETKDWSDRVVLATWNMVAQVLTTSIVNKGNMIYGIITGQAGTVYKFELNALTGALTTATLDISQTSTSGNSLTINEAGTELHAAWASKNSTYSASFNIRYAKGTIAGDGSVTWGAVEQWTKFNNTNFNVQNPSVVVNKENYPVVTMDINTSTTAYITAMSNSPSFGAASGDYLKGNKIVFSTGAYAQSSPSAIFVPQSVNGLANGRIWVAWHGTDSVDIGASNIRVSYSDDGGITWSTMQKLTSGAWAQEYPSITASKNGVVTIVLQGKDSVVGNFFAIRKITNVGGTWGNVTNVKSTASSNFFSPSALYDPAISFTEPLFIYKDTAKVGFYGAWTTTEINVPQGSIGVKTDRTNLLTYAITSESMATITEKVNGVTIRTRTAPVSGQSYTVSLTQAQWDAVKFGKYANNTAGKNTLTIEMGTETFTYTFNKQPDANTDLITVAKSTQDYANTTIPSIKKQLVDKVGGNVADTFETIIAGAVVGRKMASGEVLSSTGTLAFQNVANTSTASYPYVTVTGLNFKPSVVLIFAENGSNRYQTVYTENTDSYYPKTVKINIHTGIGSTLSGANIKGDTSNASVSYGSFVLPVNGAQINQKWIAFE